MPKLKKKSKGQRKEQTLRLMRQRRKKPDGCAGVTGEDGSNLDIEGVQHLDGGLAHPTDPLMRGSVLLPSNVTWGYHEYSDGRLTHPALPLIGGVVYRNAIELARDDTEHMLEHLKEHGRTAHGNDTESMPNCVPEHAQYDTEHVLDRNLVHHVTTARTNATERLPENLIDHDCTTAEMHCEMYSECTLPVIRPEFGSNSDDQESDGGKTENGTADTDDRISEGEESLSHKDSKRLTERDVENDRANNQPRKKKAKNNVNSKKKSFRQGNMPATKVTAEKSKRNSEDLADEEDERVENDKDGADKPKPYSFLDPEVLLDKRNRSILAVEQVLIDWIDSNLEQRTEVHLTLQTLYRYYSEMCQMREASVVDVPLFNRIIHKKLGNFYGLQENSQLRDFIKMKMEEMKITQKISSNLLTIRFIITEVLKDAGNPPKGIHFSAIRKAIISKYPTQQDVSFPEKLKTALLRGVRHRYLEQVRGFGKNGYYRNPGKRIQRQKKDKKDDKEGKTPRAGPQERGPRIIEDIVNKPCSPCTVPPQIQCFEKSKTPRAAPRERGPRIIEDIVNKPCSPCTVPPQIQCFEKSKTRQFASKWYRPCGRVLKCGNHTCRFTYHKVEGTEDPRRAGVNCQKCESPCQFVRPEGCEHPCIRPCHPGACPPCTQMVRKRCHCQTKLKYIECDKWVSASKSMQNEMMSCLRTCPKMGTEPPQQNVLPCKSPVSDGSDNTSDTPTDLSEKPAGPNVESTISNPDITKTDEHENNSVDMETFTENDLSLRQNNDLGKSQSSDEQMELKYESVELVGGNSKVVNEGAGVETEHASEDNYGEGKNVEETFSDENRSDGEEEEPEILREEYLQEVGVIGALPSAFKYVESSLQSGFVTGMKLEVPNKTDSSSYSVATVVMTCGPLLKLRFDGSEDDTAADFWCDLATSEVHSIGWCAQNGKNLKPPEARMMDKNPNTQEQRQSLHRKTESFNYTELHTGNRTYKCDLCGKSFTANNHLEAHMRVHTGERQFTRNGDLNVPIRYHTGETPYKCGLCEKSFTQSTNLEAHMRFHTRERCYRCDVCGRSYKKKGNLIVHMRIHPGKRLKCDVCKQSFSDIESLAKHVKINSGDKPYNCGVCGQSFFHKDPLIKHLGIHMGDNPYKCDVCGKSFDTTLKLDTHMRVHTGDKHKDPLIKHLGIHMGDNPYKCDVCGKSFATTLKLDTHMRVHTGDKLHTCDFCGKCFSRSNYLNKHMRIHTDDKP